MAHCYCHLPLACFVVFFPSQVSFSAPHSSVFLFPRLAFPAHRPSFCPPHSAIPPSECTTHCPVFSTLQFGFFTIIGHFFGVLESHHHLCQQVLSGSISIPYSEQSPCSSGPHTYLDLKKQQRKTMVTSLSHPPPQYVSVLHQLSFFCVLTNPGTSSHFVILQCCLSAFTSHQAPSFHSNNGKLCFLHFLFFLFFFLQFCMHRASI